MSVKHVPTAGSDTHPLYADVIVPRHIAQAFTYLVPPALSHRIKVGHRVLVPFGRTALEAVVIAVSPHRPPGLTHMSLKTISSLIGTQEEAERFAPLFDLSRQVSEEYVAPWGQCLRLILPATRRGAPASRCLATEQGRAALKVGHCPEALRPLLERIARRSTGVLLSTLQLSGVPARDLEALTSRAWVTVETVKDDEPTKRADTAGNIDEGSPGKDELETKLPDADPFMLERIAAGLQASESKTIVLQASWEQRLSLLGVAVRQAHAMGKSTLVISGETVRAAWLGKRLSYLTGLPITLFHLPHDTLSLSGCSGEKPRERPTILVGTRSSLFTPVMQLGLIWIDQEDDSALKELQEPRYHARNVAGLRGAIERALVVLASSHPSLEAMTNFQAEVHTVGEECGRRPSIEGIDLRAEAAQTLFSYPLITAMRAAMSKKDGVLLFLNRKGFAGAIVCRDCGWVPRCSACAVALAYYRESSKLACRYCGVTEALPESCATCQASRLAPVGEGTERAEVEVRRLFPHAQVARLDGDTLRRPAAAHALWSGVKSGAFDIVIGTQALFQGEPLPRMGVVGILHADSGLHVPDFRAAERTYQLLMDAAEVARSGAGGRVIVQAFLPRHHAIESVVAGHPSRFYQEELAARRLLGYPPFRHLASLSVVGRHMALVESAAQQWRGRVEESAGGSECVMVLGPVPLMGGRPKGHYRYHLLAKAVERERLLHAVRESVTAMQREHGKRSLKFVIDIDPVDMT